MSILKLKRTNILVMKVLAVSVLVIGAVMLWHSENFAAEENEATIEPITYEFSEDVDYEFSNADSENTVHTGSLGELSIGGMDLEISEKEGIQAIAVNRDCDDCQCKELVITYSRTGLIVGMPDVIWTFVNDKGKSVNGVELSEKIGKGAIIVQTSKDGLTWKNSSSKTDVFTGGSIDKTDYLKISVNDTQLNNGCYYRIIVAYKAKEPESSAKTSKILFLEKKKYEYKRVAEVYEFYVYDESMESNQDNTTKKYNLGKTVRTEKYDGYYGVKEIEKNDPHYGWDLGQFFVSGYTESIKEDGNIVFLKNVGDQVSLWFKLSQDINNLNDNSALSIEADPEGYDQYFQTPTMDFGKGTLFVRKTNYENVTESVVPYTNFLEAETTIGTDTKIELFEEGDYEVALDYSVRNEKVVLFGVPILPGSSHYRIAFKFSVRNSNSMFYPKDIKTQSELSNNSFTENGFYLDLANSKYLQINVVREILKEGATGLTEDVRSNRSAKDGDQFTDEGIYTVTVTNQYTNQSTEKTIYVGNDDILKAYVVTGLEICDIQEKVENGATITDEGTIIEASLTEETVSQEKEKQNPKDNEITEENNEQYNEQDYLEESDNTEENSGTVFLIIVGVIFLIVIVLIVCAIRRIIRKIKGKKGIK